MRQKVVIACGLVRDATTLLFDEPLTGLDPLGIRRMRTTIVARARAGAAILLSSHLLHLVEEVCTRVIIMDRGKEDRGRNGAELASRADLAEAGSNLEQIFLHVTGHDAAAPRADVFGASLYIIGCSPRNRARRWLMRLSEPRYLGAAVVGAAYLCFVLGAQGRVERRRSLDRARAVGAQCWREFPGAHAGGAARLPGSVCCSWWPAAGCFRARAASSTSRAPKDSFYSRRRCPHASCWCIASSGHSSASSSDRWCSPCWCRLDCQPLPRSAWRSQLWVVLFTARVYFSGVGLARARLASRMRRTRRLARLPLRLVLGALRWWRSRSVGRCSPRRSST